ncbi:PPC domain-containing DNA-binding protein [Thermanaerothrix sp.]|jgi:predicted DNA-binding protein with PD1-like motif|uniref:PPC domain-containing DNA-binding protein n=1 Tax=Thermanaerothrix sp. TaxID=2972675 RepID=UPI002ADE29E7|nr:PPC domain-containing DNA-binding protein [Thermanaerothrix sp.]
MNQLPLQVVAIRLRPGQDLKQTLDAWARENAVQAAVVLTCVGSLRRAALRLADQPGSTLFEGKFEIVSLTGTLSVYGSHYHIAISDAVGQTLGGHLMEGSLVYTTAEIALGVLPGVRFERRFDPESGYDELFVTEGD